MKVYSGKVMKKVDTMSMTFQNVNEIDLVNRAGRACFKILERLIKKEDKTIIVCANSNNSADGFKIASILREEGYLQTYIHFVGSLEKMNSTCRYFYDEFIKNHKSSLLIDADYKDFDILIDSIVGIGLEGKLRDNIVRLVNNINAADKKVISIDVPTGLNSDTGSYIEHCVKAGYTIAINNYKYGHLLNDGPDMCGELFIADIGLNDFEDLEYTKVIDKELLGTNVARKKNSNKYDYGTVLVIGSSESMSGAGIMASLSALRSGAGLLTLACPYDNYEIVSRKAPLEVMVKSLDDPYDELIRKKTTVVFGPGLGRKTDYKDLLLNLLKEEINLIVDADGLYYLSKLEDINSFKRCNLIITPHTGEASNLLHITSAEVKNDMYRYAKELSLKYGCITVLKGHNTLVTDGVTTYISLTGNSGMASAGSGDVLSGMIAGISEKKTDLIKVAKAVYLHGLAGDLAKEKNGEVSMIASDIIDNISSAIDSLNKTEC